MREIYLLRGILGNSAETYMFSRDPARAGSSPWVVISFRAPALCIEPFLHGQFPAQQKYDAYKGPKCGLSEGHYWGPRDF